MDSYILLLIAYVILLLAAKIAYRFYQHKTRTPHAHSTKTPSISTLDKREENSLLQNVCYEDLKQQVISSFAKN